VTNRYDEGFLNDDERLSALIDGELDAAETAAVEARLAAEPALARRLAALRHANTMLRGAYGSVAEEPLPAELTVLLQADAAARPEAGDASGAGASVVPFGRPIRAPQFWVPSSIAAGIALAIGVWFGTALGPRDDLTDTGRLLASGASIDPGRELYEVIESMPSGETAALAGGLSATPRLTFRAADGGFCREVALSSPSRQTTIVGCRDNGAWIPEAVIQVSGTAGASADNGFVPAAGPAAELDAIVGALMAGVPLSAAAEREAIAAGWR